MKVAINCRYLRKYPEGIGWYLKELLSHWLSDHPEHEYHLLFDREPELTFESENCFTHIVKPVTTHSFSIAWWSTISINRWLKRHKPDLFFSPDGFCPISGSCKKVVTVHDIAPLVFPEHMTFVIRWYYRIFQKRMIRSADHIITVSKFSKDEIVRFTNTKPEKVSVVYNGVRDIFKPASQPDIDAIKSKHKIRGSYFLYYGSIHPRKNVIRLIRAFEAYRSKGGTFNLVISGRLAWKTKAEEEALVNSLYKDFIIHLDYLPDEELVPLISGAEALAYISTYEGFGLPVLEAMACGTVAITSTNSAMSEFSGGASILVEPLDIHHVSRILERVEEGDASIENNISQGLELSKTLSWKKAADRVMEVLVRIVG